MANDINPMFVVLIAMANDIKRMLYTQSKQNKLGKESKQSKQSARHDPPRKTKQEHTTYIFCMWCAAALFCVARRVARARPDPPSKPTTTLTPHKGCRSVCCCLACLAGRVCSLLLFVWIVFCLSRSVVFFLLFMHRSLCISLLHLFRNDIMEQAAFGMVNERKETWHAWCSSNIDATTQNKSCTKVTCDLKGRQVPNVFATNKKSVKGEQNNWTY